MSRDHIVFIIAAAIAVAWLLFAYNPNPAVVNAQQVGTCPNTANFTALAGNTATLVAARNQQVDICGFVISADTAGTRAIFKTGSTAVSDSTGLIIGASGNISWPDTGVTFSFPAGAIVGLTCGTGSCSGFVKWR